VRAARGPNGVLILEGRFGPGMVEVKTLLDEHEDANVLSSVSVSMASAASPSDTSVASRLRLADVFAPRGWMKRRQESPYSSSFSAAIASASREPAVERVGRARELT